MLVLIKSIIIDGGQLPFKPSLLVSLLRNAVGGGKRIDLE